MICSLYSPPSTLSSTTSSHHASGSIELRIVWCDVTTTKFAAALHAFDRFDAWSEEVWR